jgi:hypothetical protein
MSEAVEASIDALVEVRLARQSILTRELPLTLWAIIGESALRSSSETDGLMRDQLGRLLVMGKRPNVNIQVLPAGTRLHVGQVSSFAILKFGHHADLDVVHTEALASTLYVEESSQVGAYRDAWQRLSAAALPVEASAKLITEIRKNA